MRDRAWRVAEQGLKMRPCTQLCLRGSAETHTDCWATQMDRLRYTRRPSLKSCIQGSKRPYPFTHTSVHTHTYCRSPFTTSTQRDSVREVAEADLGQNRERRAKGLAGGCPLFDQQLLDPTSPGALGLIASGAHNENLAPRRSGEWRDPEQSHEDGGRQGVGNDVSRSFHHDGKNCLSTQVFPNQSSWEAKRSLWGDGGVAKVSPGWNSIKLRAGRCEDLDVLRPQKC